VTLHEVSQFFFYFFPSSFLRELFQRPSSRG
jgi:hypothetical protein